MVSGNQKKIHESIFHNKKRNYLGDGLPRREFMYAGDLADFVFYSLKILIKCLKNQTAGLGFGLHHK
jgi:GDP-L-fucose synthase